MIQRLEREKQLEIESMGLRFQVGRSVGNVGITLLLLLTRLCMSWKSRR
jgi:hypothetical protein